MLTNTLITPNAVQEKHGNHDIGEIKVFGMWIYLMSDCILFACLFATYAVLVNGIASGPSGKEIFELKFILAETFLLLCSSITYGMTMCSMEKCKIGSVNIWLFITFLFGFSFIAIEIYDFYSLISKGFGPDSSAFLSAFFALVATHGLHVCIGLIWITIMMIQVSQRGITSNNKISLKCLNLFWHFLDIIWICVFTIVYLLGVMA